MNPNGLDRKRALLATVLMVIVTEAGSEVTWDGENEHEAPAGRPVQAKVVTPEGAPWVVVTLSDAPTLPPAVTETLGEFTVNAS